MMEEEGVMVDIMNVWNYDNKNLSLILEFYLHYYYYYYDLTEYRIVDEPLV
jgi:hypothetical protein